MIKEIIFDCFGVLTEDGWLAFMQKYGTDQNAEELGDINHQADRGLIDYETFLRKVCELTGAPRNKAHQMITTTHHPNEPLFEYIKELKNAGYKLGIISNVGAPLTDFLPKELVDLFDEVTLSYQTRAIKPEPEIYQFHLSKSGMQPEHVVFIDDREYNAQGAEQIGMHGICYKDVEQVKNTLKNLGVSF